MAGNPRIPPSPYELGLKALEEGRQLDALHAFEQAYHLNPHDTRLHEAIGQLYYEQGNYRRAREYLQYALHLAPQATGPRYQLALLELREGNTDQAVALLRRILQIDPEHGAAKQALEEERERARIARRLRVWQPSRPWREPVVLRPPRQALPDGQSRPAPLRAPHHCVNCYFRAGRERSRLYAVRYNWWNLGLVGMIFGGWPVYLIWTYLSRERRFSFEPLYCATCSSNRRLLGWAFWVLVCLAPIFGFTTLIAVANLGAYGASPVTYVLPAVAGGLFGLVLLGAVLARTRAGTQRGVKLAAAGDEDAVFRFTSREYEQAFRELNAAFVAEAAQLDLRSEAESFIPLSAESEAEPPPTPAPPPPEEPPPPEPSHPG